MLIRIIVYLLVNAIILYAGILKIAENLEQALKIFAVFIATLVLLTLLGD